VARVADAQEFAWDVNFLKDMVHLFSEVWMRAVHPATSRPRKAMGGRHPYYGCLPYTLYSLIQRQTCAPHASFEVCYLVATLLYRLLNF